MAFNKTKTDPELGLEIHKHLVKCGVETPVLDNGISRTCRRLVENVYLNK